MVPFVKKYMARSLLSFAALLLVAGIPVHSQIMIPGGGYPGGGYPGRRYPQGGQPYPGGSQSNKPEATDFTGMLRKIADNALVVESDDRTITNFTSGNSTKYVSSSGGSAKMGDFQPGDHVRIVANQDNHSVYHATRVAMVKEGTIEEHAAASQAMDDTSRPITKGSTDHSASDSLNVSSNDSPRNRPVLRRAASSSDDGTTTSANSSSRNDDPPVLRRAASSADTPATASSSNSSSSPPPGNDSDDRPRMHRAVSGADDGGPRAQIAPDASSTIATPRPSASAAPTSTSDSGNSSLPVLRRAPSATNAAQPTDSGAVVDGSHPSLHADDAGGVTRLPPVPQPGVDSEGASPASLRMPDGMPPTGDPLIYKAREAAFSFTETLPNYVVKQFTTRYATSAAHGGRTSWQALDEVTADVIEENGTEKYKNILVNGRPPREDVEKSGSWSRGEFSSLLLDVLSPSTNADFRGKRATTIVNRPAFRYDFSVEQPNSHWHVESQSQSYLPAYTGAIWIDKENYRVLRVELSAQNMPRSFPLDTVESAVDYDYVAIGDGTYLLPVHSEALSCARGTSDCSRNVIDFKNYKKFTADSSITFDPDK